MFGGGQGQLGTNLAIGITSLLVFTFVESRINPK